MSYGGKGQTYIERVPYEAQIEDQVKIFRLAENENDIKGMQYSSETLQDIVAEILGEDNPKFNDAMDKLEKEAEAEYDRRMIIYQEEIKNANCPDVVPKPSRNMNRTQLRRKFRILLKLCSDKKIFLTPRGDAVF